MSKHSIAYTERYKDSVMLKHHECGWQDAYRYATQVIGWQAWEAIAFLKQEVDKAREAYQKAHKHWKAVVRQYGHDNAQADRAWDAKSIAGDVLELLEPPKAQSIYVL